MKRRSFLARAVAAVAGLFGLGRAEAAPVPLQKVYRGRPRDGITFWEQVRMYELRNGDRFTLSNWPRTEWIAASDPHLHPNGIWGIEGESQIQRGGDPNEIIDCGVGRPV